MESCAGSFVVSNTCAALSVSRTIFCARAIYVIILNKYEYHLPLYRQVQQFRHLGFKVNESTLASWIKPAAELLQPLYERLVKEIFKSHYIQCDETTTPVIDKDKHKTNKEYLWMIRAVNERLRCFHYDDGSRAGAVIEKLANENRYKGYLQCDGFAGYELQTVRAVTPTGYSPNCISRPALQWMVTNSI